ncbi:MAG: hypothetical protein ACRC1M_01025 [Methanobacteriaceae archaeon]
MKSSNSQLRNRGFIDENDINKFKDYSTEALIKNLNSNISSERTAAIRLLSNKIRITNEDYVNKLLELLVTEKALYTRLEICNFLETGNKTTAKIMINYLGKIGNNQYKTIPNKVSKKNSYPLPRDIIARTLGKMDSNSSSILDILFCVLNSNNKSRISEVLDAIGFLIFYNNDKNNLSTIENFNIILNSLFNQLANNSDNNNSNTAIINNNNSVNNKDNSNFSSNFNFNSNNIDNKEIICAIINNIDTNNNNTLNNNFNKIIIWKTITCSSAFHLNEAISFLEDLIKAISKYNTTGNNNNISSFIKGINNDNNESSITNDFDLIIGEAKRSLNIINKNK